MLRIDGKTLKELRKELGYRKMPMCVEVGCSLTALTNWEGGLNPPRDGMIENIVEFLLSEGYTGKCVITK